jgi:hypothetical protein
MSLYFGTHSGGKGKAPVEWTGAFPGSVFIISVGGKLVGQGYLADEDGVVAVWDLTGFFLFRQALPS